MANLVINRILDSRFEFVLDGGQPISDNAPNLTTFGNIAHFKTKNGANIIKNQNISFSDITVNDTFGGTGSFTFPNIQALWTKLIELNFFLGVSGSGSGGGGVTRFDALLDTFTYFGNDGKVGVVDESQLRLVPTAFYNVKDIVDLDDVGFDTLIAGKVLSVANVWGVPKIVLSDPQTGGNGNNTFSAVGGFYYADEETKTSPLTYTSGDLQLTNDILGNETFLSQPPYGITSVWDEDNNVFNFNQLSIGDEVFLRTEILVTSNSTNQIADLRILLGEGTVNEKTIYLGRYEIDIIGQVNLTGEVNFAIKNEDWRTTDAKLLFTSNDSANIEVIGFHPYIVRKSVNIIDISDDNFRTFNVNKKQSPLTDETTLEQTVKLGYDDVSGKVTHILFDKGFSLYLRGYAATTKKLELSIYNHTKKETSIVEIDSLAYSNVSNEYYRMSIEGIIDETDFSINDSLELQISAYKVSGGGGSSELNTKGDILTFDTAPKRLGVGANGYVLTADNAVPEGVKWAELPSSGGSTAKLIPDTGSVLDFNDSKEMLCNLGSANSTATYTIKAGAKILNSYNQVLINRSTAPTITGGNPIHGATFIPNTNMYMVANWKGADRGVEYFFLNIGEVSDGVAWNEITGDQKDVNLSGFTNDLSYRLLYDRLIKDLAVTGTYTFNIGMGETWRINMTGNTVYDQSNLPPTNFTKTITIHMTGNFAPTWPTGWNDNKTGSYDGTKFNTIVVEFIDTGEIKVSISQND